MTTAEPLARQRARGALASGFATADLHHHRGHDPSEGDNTDTTPPAVGEMEQERQRRQKRTVLREMGLERRRQVAGEQAPLVPGAPAVERSLRLVVETQVGDLAAIGRGADTLFMPDFGTARCDFPGGDARQLYRSIQKIFALPDATRLFMCHDYKAPGRDEFACEEKARNIHVKAGTDENAFVEMRTARDATLGMPRLILPSVQVKMRAGRMPPPEDNGIRYLKMPLDAL